MKASALSALPAFLLLTSFAVPLGAQPAADAPAAPAAPVPAAPVVDAPAPSAEQAKMLEQQVHEWLLKMTAGVIPVPDRLVQFTPNGGGYDIAVPLGTIVEVEPKDAALTGRAHQLDATRWAIDSEQFPPSLKVTTQQRFANAVDTDAPPAIPPNRNFNPAGTHLETVTYELKFGQQTASGVFDPTYATPTSAQSSIASIDLVQVGGPAATISHVGPTVSASSITPSGNGRADMLLDTSMQTYETKTQFTGDGPSVTLTMDRVHVVTALTGYAPDRLAPLIGAMASAAKLAQATPASLPPALPPAPPAPGPKPNAPKPGAAPKPGTPKPGAGKPGAGKPNAGKPGAPKSGARIPGPDTASDPAADARMRAVLRAILVAANGVLTGGKLDETADGVKFDFSGHVGTINHLGVNFAGDAPQDALTASMGLTVDGLAIPELPPALAVFVPSHVTMHPTVSNVSVGALTRLGMDATDPDGRDPPEADYAALFRNGGINFGFDTLGLDIGDTKFSGTGTFNLAGPQTVTGQAEIIAHGLDALITQAQSNPMLAQGVPVLIFLKGIAKTNADQSVWQVSLANGRALVNGVDLMAMAGAMK